MKPNDILNIDKIKIVEGINFVTIENTLHLTGNELVNVFSELLNKPFIMNTENVNIHINSKYGNDVEAILKNNGFKFHDERITVYKNLMNEAVKFQPTYQLKDLNEVTDHDFKCIWKEAMVGSLNAPSSLTVEEQLESAKLELGTAYKDSCFIVFNNGKPIGITMPHIEPGTHCEGRIFYFGLIPDERGKGISRLLHLQTLNLLKKKFNATYYIGSTSYTNKPMLKTFKNNGCSVLERSKVYKRINNTLI